MTDTGGFLRNPAVEAPAGPGRQPITGGLLLSQANVPDIETCLGAVTMTAGAVSTDAVSHDTNEVMYVAAGRGELRTDNAVIPFATGDAIFIPAHAWHWLANTGESDLVSVFSFPTPERPPSRSRPVTTRPQTQDTETDPTHSGCRCTSSSCPPRAPTRSTSRRWVRR